MESEGKIINIDSEILGGTPVFYGTRVPIKNLFDYLETGETVSDFLLDFSSVQHYQAVKLMSWCFSFHRFYHKHIALKKTKRM